MKKGFAGILILGLIVVVFILAAIIYIKQRSKPITNIPNPIESQDETTNWKTYTNTKYMYSFMYPEKYNPYNSGPYIGDAQANDASVLVGNVEVVNSQSGEWYPIFYVVHLSDSNIHNTYNNDINDVNNFLSAAIGNTVKVQGEIFTRLPDMTVGGLNANVFVNNYGGTDSEDRRIIIKKRGKFYLVGTYTTSDNRKIFEQILATLKFTN